MVGAGGGRGRKTQRSDRKEGERMEGMVEAGMWKWEESEEGGSRLGTIEKKNVRKEKRRRQRVNGM